MTKRKVLLLTDHTNHSSENSLYDLSVKMLAHSKTKSVAIVSKGNSKNNDFFSCKINVSLWATTITESFAYNKTDHPLLKNIHQVNFNEYDLVWLRLPPPLSSDFLDYIDRVFSNTIVINNPKSIHRTGSKNFLINFPTICPPMKICTSIDEIDEFRQHFPIVLKPYNEYGGRGIVKIENEVVSSGLNTFTYDEFADQYHQNPIDYLGVKYLKNVHQGDKRIIVVNGQILGASLRLPAKNSWLCNVSMGGSSNMAEVEPEETKIVSIVNNLLSKQGIVMYGIDTLVNDNGKRVLSEINTTSIGGLPQIAAMRKEPLVEKAIDLIWDYYEEKSKQ